MARIDTDKLSWWFLTVLGAILTAVGLYGVWLQGRLYTSGWIYATVDEMREAFTLPTAVTTGGSLILAAVILASPLTAAWSLTRRLSAFACFAVSVLIACTICGYLAGSQVAKILR